MYKERFYMADKTPAGFPFRGCFQLLIWFGCLLSASCSSESSTYPELTIPTTPLAPTKDPSQVLRHAVFFSFKETSNEAEIREVVDAFRALPSKIDAIKEFRWGTNNSSEGHDDGFTHCFFLTFDDFPALWEGSAPAAPTPGNRRLLRNLTGARRMRRAGEQRTAC